MRLALGQALQEARDKAEKSGRKLGEEMDLSAPAAQARFSRVERGLTPIYLDAAVRYAHACGTTLRAILRASGVDWAPGEETDDPIMVEINTSPSIRSDLKPVARAMIDALRAVPATQPRSGGSPSFDQLMRWWVELSPENQETFLNAIEVRATAARVAARKRAKNGKRATDAG